MKTAGFNISHDGAICICNNGEIEYYLEEERVSGFKHDGFPAKSFYQLFGYETTVKQLEEYDYAFSGLKYWPVDDISVRLDSGLKFEEGVAAFVNHVILKSIARSRQNEKIKLTEASLKVIDDNLNSFHYVAHFLLTIIPWMSEKKSMGSTTKSL